MIEMMENYTSQLEKRLRLERSLTKNDDNRKSAPETAAPRSKSADIMLSGRLASFTDCDTEDTINASEDSVHSDGVRGVEYLTPVPDSTFFTVSNVDASPILTALK